MNAPAAPAKLCGSVIDQNCSLAADSTYYVTEEWPHSSLPYKLDGLITVQRQSQNYIIILTHTQIMWYLENTVTFYALC